MIEDKNLKDFKETQWAKVIADYLEGEVEKMCDITTHKSWDEVLGKQYAARLLRNFIRYLSVKESDKESTLNQYK